MKNDEFIFSEFKSELEVKRRFKKTDIKKAYTTRGARFVRFIMLKFYEQKTIKVAVNFNKNSLENILENMKK